MEADNQEQTPLTKICTKCGVEKPMSSFDKAKRGLHGHSASCKACGTAGHRSYVSNRKSEDDEFRKACNARSHRSRSDRMKTDPEFRAVELARQKSYRK
jgi:hypothetical protein